MNIFDGIFLIFFHHLGGQYTLDDFFPVKMELAYIWVAQMIPPSKPIPMIPILMAVSKFLAHSREVKGKVVPMGGQNFKMRIFEF